MAFGIPTLADLGTVVIMCGLLSLGGAPQVVLSKIRATDFRLFGAGSSASGNDRRLSPIRSSLVLSFAKGFTNDEDAFGGDNSNISIKSIKSIPPNTPAPDSALKPTGITGTTGTPDGRHSKTDPKRAGNWPGLWAGNPPEPSPSD